MAIGDTITVADLNVDETNTVLNDPSEVIVTLIAPTVEGLKMKQRHLQKVKSIS